MSPEAYATVLILIGIVVGWAACYLWFDFRMARGGLIRKDEVEVSLDPRSYGTILPEDSRTPLFHSGGVVETNKRPLFGEGPDHGVSVRAYTKKWRGPVGGNE